ncbi:hypothetical protein B0H16DRAFT_427072 [Mycena metata]|uniref:Uncharacterized protein n=1 Tax=Mycena metata TaxID=1033252 RepID=A0AAD7JH57_9AGAR|nr:hypothetical protein B0H16DRAFT_427072 [Mycena metata]
MCRLKIVGYLVYSFIVLYLAAVVVLHMPCVSCPRNRVEWASSPDHRAVSLHTSVTPIDFFLRAFQLRVLGWRARVRIDTLTLTHQIIVAAAPLVLLPILKN